MRDRLAGVDALATAHRHQQVRADILCQRADPRDFGARALPPKYFAVNRNPGRR